MVSVYRVVGSLVTWLLFSASICEGQCPFSNFRHEMSAKTEIYDNLDNPKALVAVNVIYRHAARSQQHPLPDDKIANEPLADEPDNKEERLKHFPYIKITGWQKWDPPLGPGDLITEATYQAVQLGEYLYDRYRMHGFLSGEYSPAEIHVKSSDVRRAIFTAEFCLRRLFPNVPKYPKEIITLNVRDPADNMPKEATHDTNNNYSRPADKNNQAVVFPIPIQILPTKDDNKIQFKKDCPNLLRLHEKYVTECKKVIDVYTAYKNVFEKLNLTKPDQKNYELVYQQADSSWVNCQNGRKTDYLQGLFPFTTSALHSLQFTSWTGTEMLQRLDAGPLVTELIDNFRVSVGLLPNWAGSWSTKENLHPKSKMYMYSGHDPTVSAILNTFGMFDQLPDGVLLFPLYTATILFELRWKGDPGEIIPGATIAENYVVELFYKYRKNEPALKMKFAECGDPCTLAVFEEKYAYLRVTPEKWEADCTRNMQKYAAC